MSYEPRIEPPNRDHIYQRERDIRALAREVYTRVVYGGGVSAPFVADAFRHAEAFFAECDARDAARKGGAK